MRDLLRRMTARIFFHPVDPADLPAPVPDAYLGVWRRTLLEAPGERDVGGQVFWLQTPRWHADLRIPAGRPDFSGVAGLADCDDAQLAWLARQQGFFGLTQVDGERCTWHRLQDFQPANGRRDIGRMAFEGERLEETGVEADYLEIWQRLKPSRGGSVVLALAAENGAAPRRPGWLLVAGDCFFYVRGRAGPLAAAPDLASLVARNRPSRAQWLDWLDMEISFGFRNGPVPWRIEHSTLPFRETQCLTAPGTLQRHGHQLVVEGDSLRRWRILHWSDTAGL
jgi:hypothetical protein